MATHKHNRNSFKTAREAALQVLLAVEEQGAYSNLALQSVLANSSLSSKDTGLATEIVYGTIQRLNTIDYRLQPLLKQPLAQLDALVRNLLRLSVYQLDYLDRVPDFAVLNEAVEIAKRRKPKVAGFINGVLRNILRGGKPKFPTFEQDPVRHLALVESHPEWLVKQWISQYGTADAAAICAANNQRPALSLRVNRLRTTREELISVLASQGIEAHPSDVSPDGVLLQEGVDVTQLEPFRQGLCTVQDESSMLVAACVAPKPGMRVLDACAAPGGKTTHLAELMQDQGEIIACDIYEHKTELIRKISERLGIGSIQTMAGDVRQLLPTLGEFDAILLDAPCSGFGVIRRKPDIKWRKSPEDVEAIREIQLDLLRSVAGSLKSGGTFVYSTCTTMQQENQDLIRMFLEEHSDFKIHSLAGYMPETVVEKAAAEEGWVQLLPQHFGSDGFFICRMQKM